MVTKEQLKTIAKEAYSLGLSDVLSVLRGASPSSAGGMIAEALEELLAAYHGGKDE